MNIKTLRPWTDLVKLHADVEKGTLTEALFAIDLGAIWARDQNLPPLYRDAEAFFRATYPTSGMLELLEETLASLCGRQGFNRVIKLRSPFGGGKSHTMATLLHAARDPKALAILPGGEGLPEPSNVAIAVFDGEKFDARDGRTEGSTKIQTMWGWIAWQIDPQAAYPIVAGHDRDRVAPGGDMIREVLTRGAGGRPVLILLDEVLKYMERAAAVGVLDSTLQRQAKDFFQNLTVEVAGSGNAAMVFSLQWSAREALGNIALLQEIDNLAARVDQIREPVTGDEVLRVIQRRLLSGAPDAKIAADVAAELEGVVTKMRRSAAGSGSSRQQADEEGLALRTRLREAYPFRPELVDLMRERWAAVPSFQRTRGALRFLASCLRSLKQSGAARAALGPGDVPLADAEVRVKLLKELGAQNEYDAVIASDLAGPNARAKRIDDRLAADSPAIGQGRPAQRLATAIFLYSFGGLKRDDGADGSLLPPGITESELLAACVGPDLDPVTAKSVLHDLKLSCLYLHFDGVRYCFKKDPNVTKLIEDAEQEISRQEAEASGEGPVNARIKSILEQKLAGRVGPIVWPKETTSVEDEVPLFQLAYLPLEFASLGSREQEARALQFFERCGDRPRRYRNGIGLAIPDKRQIESLRRAVRYLMAVETVDRQKKQHRLTDGQLDQLKERARTETSALEGALRDLYAAVWLPRMEAGMMAVERIEKGGKPLQATGMHERVLELLTSQGAKKVHTTLAPSKIVERLRLGEVVTEGTPPRMGARTTEVVDAFFEILDPPRLESGQAILAAIVRGVGERQFAYWGGAQPALGADGRYQVSLDRVAFDRAIAPDEVDLDSGFLILPAALPEATAKVPAETSVGNGQINQPGPVASGEEAGATTVTIGPPPQVPSRRQAFDVRFEANRDQLFNAVSALANLADLSDGGIVTVSVGGQASGGYDAAELRNGVEEPLDEAGLLSPASSSLSG